MQLIPTPERKIPFPLELINPSFEDWVQGGLIPGRAIPEGWCIGSDNPVFYTDLERFTAMSRYSLKVQGSSTPGKVWLKQSLPVIPKNNILKPELWPKVGAHEGRKYGICGWVHPFEVGTGSSLELQRMRVGYAVQFPHEEPPQPVWIDAKEHSWNPLKIDFKVPDDCEVYGDYGRVTIWLFHENIHTGINISYWDYLDCPFYPVEED